MSAYLFPVYALIHACSLFCCLYLWQRYRAPGAALIALITAGLIYDNLILSLGASIGMGSLLETLSWPRFILHALLTPFMMLAVTQIAAAGGIRWAASTRWRNAVFVLIAAMIALGAYEGLLGLQLAPSCFDGVLRYTGNVNPAHLCFTGQEAISRHGLPIPSIVGNVLTLVMGFALWRTTGWSWLMVGALLMFAAAAVPVKDYGLAVSNAGESALLLTYVLTIYRFGRNGPLAAVSKDR